MLQQDTTAERGSRPERFGERRAHVPILWFVSRPARSTTRSGDAAADAALYGASALFAGAVVLFARIPEYREWGRIAAGVYAAGAVVSWLLSGRKSSLRRRALLGAAVCARAALRPFALDV